MIRDISFKRKILKITSPVSEESSGGPVFNKDGEFVGIVTFTIKKIQNFNFAMPSNVIKDKLPGKRIIALKDANIEDYKKTPESQINLGFYLDEVGFHDDAIEAYTRAITLNPSLAEAYFGLGAFLC